MSAIRVLRHTALPLSFVLAVGIIVLQGFRITELERRVDKASSEGDLQPGTLVPGFQADDVSGVTRTVTYGADPRPTILYVFSSSCVWCDRNSVAVAALTRQVANRYRVIGVALDSGDLSGYIKAHRITFPVYTNIRDLTRSAYRLGPTPETIVVGLDGTVLQTWIGAYSKSTKAAVEHFFSVRLPDLS